jgi:hypothetical protein
MIGTPTTFSFPSKRRLYRYLGETDALVELTELATRSFMSSAKQSGDVSEFVRAQSQQHGVRVNLAELDLVSRHLGRSYIVSVYQSAERFLHEFRKEHRALYAKDWTGDGDDVDPLTVALRNVDTSEAEAEKRIGSDLISRFQYYRIARNWVVHTKESDVSKPQARFAEIVPYSVEHQDKFGSLKAPNPPSEVGFDDFIFFSRLTKLIAEKLCRIAEPPLDHWVRKFPLGRFKRLEKNPSRMRNAVTGRLRTEYGMDTATAQWIADELCGSLAQR